MKQAWSAHIIDTEIVDLISFKNTSVMSIIHYFLVNVFVLSISGNAFKSGCEFFEEFIHAKGLKALMSNISFCTNFVAFKRQHSGELIHTKGLKALRLNMVTCQSWADPHDESRNLKHTRSSFSEIHKDGKVGIFYIA